MKKESLPLKKRALTAEISNELLHLKHTGAIKKTSS